MDFADSQPIVGTQELVDDDCSDMPKPTREPWGRLFSMTLEPDTIELVDASYTLGRHSSCNRVFHDPVISNTHCCIFRDKPEGSRTPDDSVTFIEDRSSNGTFINGQLLGKGKKIVLQSGDQIALTQKKKTAPTYKYLAGDDLRKPSSDNPLTATYHLMKRLGKGACGEVQLAVHKTSGLKFAVKIIQKKRFNSIGLPVSTDQLMQEVDILKKLNHPNVVGVHDMFDTPEALYIVLELVKGGELFDRIIDRNRFTEDETRLLFWQMLEAVKYLHAQGVTHRDLKPENILLSSDQMDAVIKITDFGLAKLVGPKSFMKTMCGTPTYQAPEVLEAGVSGTTAHVEGYSSAVDMWSLGVILYICLAGYPPFSEEITWHKKTVHEQILQGIYNFPDKPWAKLSPECRDLVKRLLTVNPKERLTVDQALAHPWLDCPQIVAKGRAMVEAEAALRAQQRRASGAAAAAAGVHDADSGFPAGITPSRKRPAPADLPPSKR